MVRLTERGFEGYNLEPKPEINVQFDTGGATSPEILKEQG